MQPGDMPPSDGNADLESAQAGADRLKQQWSHRATTDACRFYVASHAGWRDPAHWEHQARFDVSMLSLGLDADWLRQQHVLEMGCGVGRLVPFLLDRVASYTGFDVAPGMIQEAKAACGDDRARFFESSGEGVPEPAKDRSYGLVFSWAVLIHYPKQVIQSMVDDAVELLPAGGLLRAQLLADETDLSGMTDPSAVGLSLPDSAAPADLEPITDLDAEVPADAKAEGHDYMGHAFTMGEVQADLPRPGCQLSVYRFDPKHIYCDWRKQ